MVRILFSMVLWVMVAQWLYNEARILVPGLIPYIDAAYTRIQIPTHDRWDTTKFERVLAELLPEQYRALDAEQPLREDKGSVRPVLFSDRVEWRSKPRGYEVF